MFSDLSSSIHSLQQLYSMNTKLQLLIFITIFTITSSSSSNYTLYGTAHINQTTITLTQPLTNCTSNPQFSNTGRLFFKNPIQFQDSDSFATRFTFIITPPPPNCLSGEGITFLITPHINSLPYSPGSIGLPGSGSPDSTFFAVEFDTGLDQGFNDINDNHVGVDANSVVSIASVDLNTVGVELKSGKPISSWIEYNNSKKVIGVWVGYDPGVKPDGPILTAPIDLSKRFHGFVYVGFTGSNGKGSSVYSVSSWEFKTFGSGSGSGYPDVDAEEIGLENCMICFPEVSHNDPGRPGSGYETETGLVKNHHTGRTGFGLAIWLLAVNLVLVILTVCCVVLYVCFYKKQSQSQSQSQGQSQTRTRKFELTFTMPKRMKLSEIRSATKGFNRNMIIGDGVSSVVYKTDRNMAVKRFKTAMFGSQVATEFVTMVGSLQHKNLMKIRGWCCERSELIIVYDYMPNGSLDKAVHNLSFETRLNVLIGVSSALVYLHEECDRLIIHRNVKSSNVMLDSDFTAKLGDFEMGEFYVHGDLTGDVTMPARAMGYLAPEYVYSRVPTVKTDVYSFGVVVLEVASGRPAVDDNGVVVTDWVWDLWEEKKLADAADRNLVGKFDRIAMELMLMVGLICVHPNYRMRPRMKEVLRMLKGEVVPNLPDVKPTVLIRSVSSERSPEVVVVKCGGDEVGTSWGTPTSHFD